jgi:hypothetical protein
MPRRVNPIMLLGLVIALILSLGLFAGAQSGGGAVGTALGQVGKPYAFGSDGPGSFSCTGLVRFALRSVGIMDAPWDHHAYLSAYPTVANPEPGDVVVYPDGAAMYVGDGTVVMANHADGQVGTYPMNSIGTPVGFARPTGGGGTGGGGAGDPAAVDPAMGDPAIPDGQMADGQMAGGQMAGGQMAPNALPVGDPNALPVGDPNALPVGDPNALGTGDPNALPVGDPNALPVSDQPPLP